MFEPSVHPASLLAAGPYRLELCLLRLADNSQLPMYSKHLIELPPLHNSDYTAAQ